MRAEAAALLVGTETFRVLLPSARLDDVGPASGRIVAESRAKVKLSL